MGDLDKNKVGKVLKIDENSNDESIIKISSKDELLPKVLSIVKSGFVNPAPIIKAIRRFVNSSLKDEKKYKATYEILNKNYPKIKNIKEGENIIKDKDFLIAHHKNSLK